MSPDAHPVGKGNLCGQHRGFNLHGSTKVSANDAQGRLALCKYVLRPRFAAGQRPPGKTPLRLAALIKTVGGASVLPRGPAVPVFYLCFATLWPRRVGTQKGGATYLAARVEPGSTDRTSPRRDGVECSPWSRAPRQGHETPTKPAPPLGSDAPRTVSMRVGKFLPRAKSMFEMIMGVSIQMVHCINYG